MTVLHIGHIPSCLRSRFCFIRVIRPSLTSCRFSTLLKNSSSSGLYGFGLGENFSWFSLWTRISCMSFSKSSCFFSEYPQNIHEFVYPFLSDTFLKYLFAIARLPRQLFLCFRRIHLQSIPKITHPRRFFVSVQPPLLLK